MRRRYSDEEKAEALVILKSCGGNFCEASRKSGIPRPTLQHWANGEGVHPVVPELEHQKREPLADRMEALAHQIFDLLPDKLKGTSARDLAVTAAIMLDKMRLLREQPTSIDEHNIRVTDEERADRALAIFESARARRTGLPDRDTPAVN